MPLSEFQINIVAGGGAGLVETAATYPLDLAKTRQQLASTASSEPVPRVLAAAYREGGLGGLWRGVSAPLMSEVPRRALKFTMNGAFKAQLSATFPLPRSRAADVALAACAGAAAGGSETLVHTPFEVVKIRVQAGGGSGSVPSTALGIVRAEGVRGLYAGLGAYALRQMVWNGGFFGMLGLGNTILPATTGGSKAGRDFLLGLISGSVATVFNNPLDVAKSRIQAGGGCRAGAGAFGAEAKRSRWTVGVVLDILASEGLRGWCKGLPARLYRSAPGHGLLYMGFELFSSLLRQQ